MRHYLKIAITTVVLTLLTPAVVVAIFFAYLYIGTVTGYFEWRDAKNAQAFLLPCGRSLGSELTLRLREHSVFIPASWEATDYGPVSTVTACVQGTRHRDCAAFDFNHHDWLVTGNPLAKSLFPELPTRGFSYGIPLDHFNLESLNVVRSSEKSVLPGSRQMRSPGA